MIMLPRLTGEWALMYAYEGLVAALPQPFTGSPNPHSPKLVIAFGSAHCLSEIVQLRYRPSHLLCKVIRVFSKTCPHVSSWVLFASVSSKVADVSPLSLSVSDKARLRTRSDYAQGHTIYPSHHISQERKLLFQPFVQLGWDQMASKLKELELEPQEVARFDHIVGYGRPLFVSPSFQGRFLLTGTYQFVFAHDFDSVY